MLGIRRDRAPENSHQRHKQLNKEKKERTQDLTSFDNLPSPRGKGREFLLNQSITGYRFRDINIGDTTPPYIAKETTKKKKPKIPNSDLK